MTLVILPLCLRALMSYRSIFPIANSDQNNQMMYVFDAAGVIGETFPVKGVYQPYIEVADRKYRLRILDGSNARFYDLTLSTGEAFTQIGTESGLLPAPIPRTTMQIGPAERLDVIVDFTGKLGKDVYLMEADSLTPLLTFHVTQHVTDNRVIPASLRALPDIGEPTVTRSFNFDSTSSHWTINGQLYDPGRIDAQPVLGTTERWLFSNPTDTTHMVHIHDVDQQCLSLTGNPAIPMKR